MLRARPRIRSAAITALLLVLPVAARAESAATVADDPAGVVDCALRDTLTALRAPPEEPPTRRERLHAVLARYFDIGEIGRNSVGAAWRLVPPAQQADFLVTFETFLVTSYVGSLGRAGDLRFGPAHLVAAQAVAAGRPADDRRALVRVDALTADGPPHPVLVVLSRGDDARYRIVDVSAESISLGRVLAADFRGFLSRNGGRLEALAAALREKIAGTERASASAAR
jgi:ABC-type transporter MlaC component